MSDDLPVGEEPDEYDISIEELMREQEREVAEDEVLISNLSEAPDPTEDVPVEVADDPEMVEGRKGRDPLAAPYRRFRDDPHFYADADPPGSFSGDLFGCGLACRQCWSSYGLAGKDKMRWLMPREAAKKLIDGARKKGRGIIRLSNGEAFLYPEHSIEVARLIMEDEELLAGPEDQPDLTFQIETNGINATPEHIAKLNEIAKNSIPEDVQDHPGARDATGISIWWSAKCADAEQWCWYTGRTEAEYEKMMANLEWALRNAHYMTINVGFVDQMLRGPEQEQEIKARLEKWRPGIAAEISFEHHRVYFPHERPIDKRMGERRIRVAQKGRFWGQPGWNEEWVGGNNIHPPFPRPKGGG